MDDPMSRTGPAIRSTSRRITPSWRVIVRAVKSPSSSAGTVISKPAAAIRSRKTRALLDPGLEANPWR
jgi:hypothetical protein